MRAIQLKQPGEFTTVDIKLDKTLKENEALIKIHNIGICGTDYHAFNGVQPFFEYPRILGHELGAEIIALGEKNNSFDLKIGDKVAVEPYINCGSCQPCQSGKQNCCESLEVLGIHSDGGMTDLIKVPMNKLHVSKTLPTEALALVETLGIGCHAVNRAELKANQSILVIGAGPIGLTVMLFAKLRGCHVTAIDFNSKRLDFAKEKLGVETILLTKTFDREEMRDALGGSLPEVVYDVTGNEASMKKAFDYPAPGGKLVFVGLFLGDVVFNDPSFHKRELTLLASRNALPSDFKYIIEKMENGEIDTAQWISHRLEFNNFPTQFKSLLKPEELLIKAVVKL